MYPLVQPYHGAANRLPIPEQIGQQFQIPYSRAPNYIAAGFDYDLSDAETLYTVLEYRDGSRVWCRESCEIWLYDDEITELTQTFHGVFSCAMPSFSWQPGRVLAFDHPEANIDERRKAGAIKRCRDGICAGSDAVTTVSMAETGRRADTQSWKRHIPFWSSRDI